MNAISMEVVIHMHVENVRVDKVVRIDEVLVATQIEIHLIRLHIDYPLPIWMLRDRLRPHLPRAFLGLLIRIERRFQTLIIFDFAAITCFFFEVK